MDRSKEEISMNTSKTYTLYTRIGVDERIIARGLSAVEAMRHIVKRELDREFCVTCENYETFRSFDCSLSLDRLRLSYGPPTFHATVPITEEYETDEASALELIAIQFLRFAYHHWDGWVVADDDFEERLRDRLLDEAALQENERIEHEIAAKLVDALTRGGYETVTDTIGNEFSLSNTSDRESLLEFFFNHRGIAEYTVMKTDARHSFHISFDLTALEIIQSASKTIAKLLQPIIAPYRQVPQMAASCEVIEFPITGPSKRR
jgi:hypothetical protein